MLIALFVGPKFRDLTSIQNYVKRLGRSSALLLRQPMTKGERLAWMTAQRRGVPVEVEVLVPDLEPSESAVEAMLQRIAMVKSADTVVVFDDGSPDLEHAANVAQVNSKDLLRFREV